MMSIEQTLQDLLEAVKDNTAALREAIGAAGATGGTAATAGAEAGAKPAKATKATKATKADAPKEEAPKEVAEEEEEEEGVTYLELRSHLSEWLGEFAKPEDKDNPAGAHPEVAARTAKLKETIKKLGSEKLAELADKPAECKRLAIWLGKAKALDNGFGSGRFVADPVGEPEAEADDLDV